MNSKLNRSLSIKGGRLYGPLSVKGDINLDSSFNFKIDGQNLSAANIGASNIPSIRSTSLTTNDYLVIRNNSGDLEYLDQSFNPTHEDKYLRKDGSWTVIDIPDITIAGSNGQIQFNNNGSLGADSNLF
jgi:hypothetical protein